MLGGPKGTDKNGATRDYIHLNVYSKTWGGVDDAQANAYRDGRNINSGTANLSLFKRTLCSSDFSSKTAFMS
uniref:Uncharacterized protein n=1 Tax=Romanomermis culicivorax TaxID=13658 RepID=A0A915KTW6_ROMCU